MITIISIHIQPHTQTYKCIRSTIQNNLTPNNIQYTCTQSCALILQTPPSLPFRLSKSQVSLLFPFTSIFTNNVQFGGWVWLHSARVSVDDRKTEQIFNLRFYQTLLKLLSMKNINLYQSKPVQGLSYSTVQQQQTVLFSTVLSRIKCHTYRKLFHLLK